MNYVVTSLLWTVRLLLFTAPFMAVLTGRDFQKFWVELLMFFYDVTLRNFAFRIVIEIAGGLWVVLVWLAPRYRPRLDGAMLALVALTAIAGIADLFGVNPSHSYWSNLERMEGWVGLIHLLTFFVMATSVFDSHKLWRAFFLVSMAVAAFIVVRVVGQAFFDVETYMLRKDMRFFRADARLGSPVYLAIYMLFHAFLAGWLLARVVSAGRHSGWLPYRAPLAFLATLGSAAFAWAMQETATRISWPAVAAGGGAAFVLTLVWAVRGGGVDRRTKRLAWVGLLVFGALAALVLVTIILKPAFLRGDPTFRRFLGAIYAFRARAWVWNSALDGFFERPLLGWGQENFSYVFDAHYDPRLFLQNDWYDRPHNVFLGWFVNTGVFGGIAYVAIYVTTLRALWRRASSFLLVDRAALTGLLVACAVFLSFQPDNLTSYILFLSVVGYVHVVRGAGTPAPPIPRLLRSRPPAVLWTGALVLAGAGGYGTYRAVRSNAEEMYIAHHLQLAMQEPVSQTPDGKRHWPTIRNTLEYARHSFQLTEIREQAARVALEKRYSNKLSNEMKIALLDLSVRELKMQVEEDGERVRLRTLLWFGYVLNRLKRFGEAVPYLERGCKMAPTRQNVRYELGRSLIGLERYPEAVKLARETWLLAKQNDNAHILYAVAAAKAGNYQLTKKIMNDLYGPAQKIHRPDQRLVDALFQAGYADLLVPVFKRLIAGIHALQRTGKIEIGPGPFIRRYLSLAVTYEQAGRKQLAIKTLNDLVKVVPNFRKHAAGMIRTIRTGQSLIYRQLNGVYRIRGMARISLEFQTPLDKYADASVELEPGKENVAVPQPPGGRRPKGGRRPGRRGQGVRRPGRRGAPNAAKRPGTGKGR